MKRFDIRTKKSPIAGKKISEVKFNTDADDGISDFTDSEPGVPLDHDLTDGTRSTTPDPTRTREALDSIRSKIDRVKKEIQVEQALKEENVKEYLQLFARAANDEAKAKNIKLVFEKQNQGSAQTIAKLQKKLERYQNEAKHVEHYGASSHRAAKEVLKEVGQGIKDFGGSVVDNLRTATDALVPKTKDRTKSGSADNINSLARGEGHSIFYTGFLDSASANGTDHPPVGGSVGSPTSPNGSTTLPANFKLHIPSGSDDAAVSAEAGSASDGSYQARESTQNSSASPDVLQTSAHSVIVEPLLQRLGSNADAIEKLVNEVTVLRAQVSDMQEDMISRASNEEERIADRYDRLEEHLNDFVELTQNELTNLKQEISNMEEKIDYQLDERTRDLQEALENATTRISKMELQSQHQQLITMEVDNPNARMLLTKGINVILAFLAVLLVFISTISQIIGPFLNARWKVVSLVLLVFGILFASSRWELIAELIEQKLLHRRSPSS